MKRASFTLETFPGKRFFGFTNGEDWNGWACPYFTFQEAQRIAELHNELPGNFAYYQKEKDSFVFKFNDDPEEYPTVSFGETNLYPIGNGSWIWEEECFQAVH